jgi:hypothetical protein
MSTGKLVALGFFHWLRAFFRFSIGLAAEIEAWRAINIFAWHRLKIRLGYASSAGL